nr:MAG TPA: hypothetical protein [Caudoviricetes sp.]DAL44433.1 MAG TPA_asm: hypothetical protein [Bacteriophage sp.]DAL74314.1 MAG TPA: hypothetical protein [Caudoviricetes sp.]DAT98208.1 MAG TPA: hypothetical protein [Caudoviricetes sp.]
MDYAYDMLHQPIIATEWQSSSRIVFLVIQPPGGR